MGMMDVLDKVKKEMLGNVAKIEASSSNFITSAKGTIASAIFDAKKEIPEGMANLQTKLDTIASDSSAKITALAANGQTQEITNVVNNAQASIASTVKEAEATSAGQPAADSTTKKDDKTTAVYTIILTRADTQTGELLTIDDFHYLMISRNPIEKQATMMEGRAMVQINALEIIEENISYGIGVDQNYPEWELSIYQLLDGDSPDGGLKLIYTTSVIITMCHRDMDKTATSNPTIESAIPTIFTMFHPIICQLSKNTGGNNNIIFGAQKDPKFPLNPRLIALETIINEDLDEVKPNEMESFTDYIIKKYAGDKKNIKQIILGNKDKEKINQTSQDQITVPSTLPEINIPEYLIHTYKPFSTPSYWFLDTFNFANYDDESKPEFGKIPIWCFLINFDNCIKKFKSVDISKRVDATQSTHKVLTNQFTDVTSKLLRSNAVVTYRSKNMAPTITRKLGGSASILTGKGEYETQENRMTSINVYVPDNNIDEAEKRIIDCVDLFKAQINNIEYFETLNSTPDWLHFGKIYNLEKDPNTMLNKESYIHTPIMILHIFRRRQTKETSLECINRFAMLRMYDPTGPAVNAVPSAIPAPVPAPTPPPEVQKPVEVPPAPVTVSSPAEVKKEEPLEEDLIQKAVDRMKFLTNKYKQEYETEKGGKLASSQLQETLSRYQSTLGNNAYFSKGSKAYNSMQNQKSKDEAIKRYNALTVSDMGW